MSSFGNVVIVVVVVVIVVGLEPEIDPASMVTVELFSAFGCVWLRWVALDER